MLNSEWNPSEIYLPKLNTNQYMDITKNNNAQKYIQSHEMLDWTSYQMTHCHWWCLLSKVGLVRSNQFLAEMIEFIFQSLNELISGWSARPFADAFVASRLCGFAQTSELVLISEKHSDQPVGSLFLQSRLLVFIIFRQVDKIGWSHLSKVVCARFAKQALVHTNGTFEQVFGYPRSYYGFSDLYHTIWGDIEPCKNRAVTDCDDIPQSLISMSSCNKNKCITASVS